ncbi:acetyltransferase [Vibrio cholerae]|nr:acetyltransferase [Vibrio cholerae]
MVAVVVIEFGGMRCQPLRRALYKRRMLYTCLKLSFS